MGYHKKFVKQALGSYAKSPKSLPINKLKQVIAFVVIAGIIGTILGIFLLILVIRWVWNAGSSVVQQNPTVSSVVETTKQQVTDLVPTIPYGVNDFITNGQLDAAKLSETYASLPEQTQQVWKSALEANINEMLKTAAPAEVASLMQLLNELNRL